MRSARTIGLGEGGERIVFQVEDLCRHTMIFGSSGSGKTTRAYNPLLQAMLADLGAGAFIIAAKAKPSSKLSRSPVAPAAKRSSSNPAAASA